MSGAMTSREHDKGRPPPRMSSKEAIPDDVRIVEGENDEARVPARWSTVLDLDFLLKVDMIDALRCVGRLEITDGPEVEDRNFHLISYHDTTHCHSPPQTTYTRSPLRPLSPIYMPTPDI